MSQSLLQSKVKLVGAITISGVRWSILALGLLAIFVISLDGSSLLINDRLPTADARQYAIAASNIVNHGVFSSQIENVEPEYRRDVGYAAILAFSNWGVLDGVSARCVVGGEECASIRGRLTAFNAYVSAILPVVAGIGVFWITKSVVLSMAVGVLLGLSRWFIIGQLYPEALSAILFLCHSLALYGVMRSADRKVWWALFSGLSLAFLVLTKAVFVFWLYLLIGAGAAFIWTRWRGVWLALVIAPVLICGGWMARNAYHFGDFRVSGRDGEILMIRSSFLDMASLEDYWAGVVAFSPAQPEWLKSALMNTASSGSLQKYNRSNPEGFYRSGKNATSLALSQSERDAELRSISSARILSQPLKYLAQVPLFAWRAAFPDLGSYSATAPFAQAFHAAVYVRLVGFAAMLGLFFAALIRRNFALVALLLPAMFCWGIHAAATHAIPRYSAPIVPIMLISVAIVCAWVIRHTKRALWA